MDDKETKTVKCETCGFFSRHGRGSSAPTPRYYEIETIDRTNTNEIFSYYADNRHVSCEVVCFQRKVNFMREINRLGGQGERDAKLVEMVRLDRHCDAWYQYLEGFDPMEHFRWHQAEIETKARQNYEAVMEADRRKYEREMAQRSEDDRRLFERNLDAARETREARDRILLIVGLLLTGAGVLLAAAQVIAAIIFSLRESYTDRLLKSIFG